MLTLTNINVDLALRWLAPLLGLLPKLFLTRTKVCFFPTQIFHCILFLFQYSIRFEPFLFFPSDNSRRLTAKLKRKIWTLCDCSSTSLFPDHSNFSSHAQLKQDSLVSQYKRRCEYVHVYNQLFFWTLLWGRLYLRKRAGSCWDRDNRWVAVAVNGRRIGTRNSRAAGI